MTLKKMIDGVILDCSPEEEGLILKRQALIKSYPNYSGHLMFDGISDPEFDMVECRKTHAWLVESLINEKIQAVNAAIEAAQEDGKDFSSLLQKRKLYKSFLNPDLSDLNTIEELDFHLKKIKALD